MSEANHGTCQYCGQSRIIETVGEVSQAERDAMATEACNCPEAQSAKRKAERDQKKETYLHEKLANPEHRELMAACIEAVDKWDSGIDWVQIRMTTGEVHKISMTKDYNLKIKVTKKNEEETTI